MEGIANVKTLVLMYHLGDLGATHRGIAESAELEFAGLENDGVKQ